MKRIIDISDKDIDKVRHSDKAIFYDVYRMMANIIQQSTPLNDSTKDGCQYDDITETIPPFEPCEIEASKLQQAYNKGFGDCRQALLDTISELNAISFYEAQEDSKECYYEIRQAVENMSPITPKPKTKQDEYDDAKYHEEHGEVVVEKDLWEDAKRALEQGSVLNKIKTEIDLDTRIQVKHYTNTDAVIDAVLDVIDKYKTEEE